MRITFKGDYAIKALLFLARKSEESPGEFYQISEIAGDQDIPLKFLEQIFLLLRKAGYLKSHRGTRGGFALNRKARDIRLGEIIRLIDGPVAPIACVSTSAHQACDFEPRCVLKPIWAEVNRSVRAVVDPVTFSDLVKRERELRDRETGPAMYHI